MPCVLDLIENNHPNHMNHPRAEGLATSYGLELSFLVCSCPAVLRWDPRWERKVVQRAKKRRALDRNC